MPEVQTVCYVCNRFVDKPHNCPEAKKLAENPKEMVTWMHSDGRPTVTKGIMI